MCFGNGVEVSCTVEGIRARHAERGESIDMVEYYNPEGRTPAPFVGL